MYKGETIEEWVPLTGKQGDEKEGNVNMIMSLTVSNINNCIMISYFVHSLCSRHIIINSVLMVVTL